MKIFWMGLALLALSSFTASAGDDFVIPDFTLELVASNLSSPIALRHAGDGSGRIFVLEREGRIRIIEANGQLLDTPFLDFSADNLTDLTSEGGLLGIDFHPDYENNGLFYLNYTTPGVGATQIARYSVSVGDPNIADPNSGIVILSIDQDFVNHNGGDIHFGPDGFLYIGMGDGGSGGDPNNRAQNPQSLLGKMLRIDVDNEGVNSATACGDDTGQPTLYAIPPNNPFAGDDGFCDEIWALGVRNPFRFSFDRLTGDLFIGDVGQNAFEEISFQPAASTGGENYGWDCREGFSIFGSSAPVCTGNNPPMVIDPIIVNPHVPNSGDSITGGYRYRGGFGAARGLYYFADIRRQEVFVAQENVGQWTSQTIPAPFTDPAGNTISTLSVVAFGEDEDGELYLVDFGGRIFRFGQVLYSDGFETP